MCVSVVVVVGGGTKKSASASNYNSKNQNPGKRKCVFVWVFVQENVQTRG